MRLFKPGFAFMHKIWGSATAPAQAPEPFAEEFVEIHFEQVSRDLIQVDYEQALSPFVCAWGLQYPLIDRLSHFKYRSGFISKSDKCTLHLAVISKQYCRPSVYECRDSFDQYVKGPIIGFQNEQFGYLAITYVKSKTEAQIQDYASKSYKDILNFTIGIRPQRILATWAQHYEVNFLEPSMIIATFVPILSYTVYALSEIPLDLGLD
jgi:hypothetical protein